MGAWQNILGRWPDVGIFAAARAWQDRPRAALREGLGGRVTPTHPRVLLVGAGGIGGVLGTLLAATPARLSVLTSNERIGTALRERGFRLRGDGTARSGR